MPQYIALLRGINVGKAKRVPMAELRALLSGLGHTDVATLLNSGNATFHASRGASAKHARDIAAAISSELQVEVPVIVKTVKELAMILAENPFRVDAAGHSRFLVVFTQQSKALAGLTAVKPLVTASEKFAIGEHAAYLHCPEGILESKVGKALLGKAGDSVTTRNWATVLKLQDLATKAGA